MSIEWNASADRPDCGHLRLRAALNRRLRAFFERRGVLEVETPILAAAGTTDPNIESFVTRFEGPVAAAPGPRWLRTSPEFALKRLLAAGVGDCFELGRVFRNGEAGRRHNPEFTLLEWYRVGWDHRRLAHEVRDLVQDALALAGCTAEYAEFSYRQWFLDGLGIDPFEAGTDALRAPLAGFRIAPDGLGRDDWLDLLVTHRLQPGLPSGRVTCIHDYPPTQAALARIRDGDPPVAERFEIFLGSQELANGYHELCDPAEQRARFEADNRRRAERGQAQVPIDERLLAVLARMPDCAGVALGVDRLLMALAGTDDLREVLAIPFAVA